MHTQTYKTYAPTAPQTNKKIMTPLEVQTLLDDADNPEYWIDLLEVAWVEQYEEDGQIVAKEGENARVLYIILEGGLEILKKDVHTGKFFSVEHLKKGDYVGEGALFSGATRSATMRTLGKTTLLVIPAKSFSFAPLYTDVLLHLLKQLSGRLSNKNEVVIASLKNQLAQTTLRLETNRLLIYMILGLSFYAVGVSIAIQFSDNFLAIQGVTYTFSLLLVFAIFSLIKQSPYPLSFFGFVWPKSWRKDLWETALWSLVLIISSTLSKYVAIQAIPLFQDLPLFYSPLEIGGQNALVSILFMIAYVVLIVPLQEIFARGTLQSLLHQFFANSSHQVFYGILLSNTVFAAMHAHGSAYFALIVFLPGCIWGIMYARQRSLVGVIISHIVVGVWALRILGVTHFLFNN